MLKGKLMQEQGVVFEWRLVMSCCDNFISVT